MLALKNINRFQAFAIHILLSLLFFGIVFFLIVDVWYSGFFYETSGGDNAVRLIIGIDLILGPLLTLLVYDVKKASLKQDLQIILCLQLAALSAGVYTIWNSRPAAVVYHHPEFTTIYAGQPVYQRIKPLLETAQGRIPFLYYRDKTGGADVRYEYGKFLSYEESVEEVRPLMQSMGRFPNDKGILTIPLDSSRQMNYRLLVKQNDLSVLGLAQD